VLISARPMSSPCMSTSPSIMCCRRVRKLQFSAAEEVVLQRPGRLYVEWNDDLGARQSGDSGFADRGRDAGFGQGGFGSMRGASSYSDHADSYRQSHPKYQHNASQFQSMAEPLL
jgi:hypothetical protein